MMTNYVAFDFTLYVHPMSYQYYIYVLSLLDVKGYNQWHIAMCKYNLEPVWIYMMYLLHTVMFNLIAGHRENRY